MENKKVHNPLITISKQTNQKPWISWCIRIGATILALLVCAIVSTLLTKKDMGFFFTELFGGAFKTPRRIWNLLEEMAMLLIIALAITPAFKMKFWNIGAEGQVLVGGLVSAGLMLNVGSKMPNGLLILIMLVLSILAGIIWAVIPAIFKAQWNTNETLFTLMMNYIAMKLVAYCISVWIKSGSGVIEELPYGNLPTIGGQAYLLNIIIVAMLTVLVTLYLTKSKHGYELSVVGESLNTAKYVGINVKKVIIRTMILSGALCGIAGFLLVSGAAHTVTESTVGGRGFTAILVSWLAHFDPIFMILTSFLVAFITRGSAQVATKARLGNSFPNIMTGIFFFFIIASEFFINYKVHFHFNFKKKKLHSTNLVEEAKQ